MELSDVTTIADIPVEILLDVFSYVDSGILAFVCRRWRDIADKAEIPRIITFVELNSESLISWAFYTGCLSGRLFRMMLDTNNIQLVEEYLTETDGRHIMTIPFCQKSDFLKLGYIYPSCIPGFCLLAARHGKLDFFEGLGTIELPGLLIETAISNGHVAVAEHLVLRFTTTSLFSKECLYRVSIIRGICKSGNLELLTKLKMPKSEICEQGFILAIKHGHVAIVQHMVLRNELVTTIFGNSSACDVAAGSGHLEMVQLCKKLNICKLSGAVLPAIRNGHVDIVFWLYSIGIRVDICGYLADSSIAMVEWALDHPELPRFEQLLMLAILNNNVDQAKLLYARDDICWTVNKPITYLWAPGFEMCEWLSDKAFTFNDDLFYQAIQTGSTSLMKRMLNDGIVSTKSAVSCAMANNQFDAALLLHSIGVVFEPIIGIPILSIKFVRWLLKHNYVTVDVVLMTAIVDLPLLKWCHKQGYDWRRDKYINRVIKHRTFDLRLFDWIKRHGVDFTLYVTTQSDTTEWLKRHQGITPKITTLTS
jgi:hypothetical protein